MSETTKGRADKICPRCHNLDLDDIFLEKQSRDISQDPPVAVIENLSRNCRQANCDLCRFLSSLTLLNTATLRDTWTLCAHDFARLTSGKDDSDSEDQFFSNQLVLSMKPLDSETQRMNAPSFDTCDLLVQAAEDDSVIGDLYGRIVNTHRVDYNLLKSWLSCCLNDHDSCSASSPGTLMGMKVIDCVADKVVHYQRGKYAALSYCIGPITRRRHRPKVVADAILCCKGLGIPYLWVDSICIDQLDKVALAQAISNMHLVYSAATVTIVSLGLTQSHGLPGVSNVARLKQPVLRTARATYVSTMHNLPVAIAKSRWMTRAWCFQEAVLSRRILFFGKYQAYFLCNESIKSESTTVNLHCPAVALAGLRSRRDSHDATGYFDTRAWNFGAWLDQYTVRELTYQTDALNAFHGVLNVYRHYSLWGVPLVPGGQKKDLAAALATGLSWSTSYNKHAALHHWIKNINPDSTSLKEKWLFPSADFYCRPGFPSWAWPACRTFRQPLFYKSPGDFRIEYLEEMDGYQTDHLFQIHLENQDGRAVSLEDVVDAAEQNILVLPQFSRFLHITTSIFTLKLCRLIFKPSTSILSDDIAALKNAILEAEQSENPQALVAQTNSLQKARRQLQRFESLANDLEKEVFARYCIQIKHASYPSLGSSSIELEHNNSEEAVVELDDGRFLVDFDRPPTIEDGYCDQVECKDLIGLLLFRRAEEMTDSDSDPTEASHVQEGEYCILVAEKHSSQNYYQRIGLLWIDAEHLALLHKTEERIRLG